MGFMHDYISSSELKHKVTSLHNRSGLAQNRHDDMPSSRNYFMHKTC